MNEFTLIVPFYRNCAMLKRQVEEWNQYPAGVKVICVDDGSPEPALPIVGAGLKPAPTANVQVYRIGIDIPWNRNGARNLGAKQSTTEWIVQIDIDHILPADAAEALLRCDPNPKCWYRFPRWRRGTADATRKKDALPDDVDYGMIHPHVDSYLVRNKTYWKTGGYDEDYSGVLGGGGEFLKRLSAVAQLEILQPPIRLEVYTRSEIADASDWSLSRDSAEYSARKRHKAQTGDTVPKNPLRFPWERQEMSKYPDVIGEFGTVDALLTGKSIARLGDGELKLTHGGEYAREPVNAKLGAELADVLQQPHKDCLVGVPTMDPNGPKYENWLRHKKRFSELIYSGGFQTRPYHSAFISRPDSAPWINTVEYAAQIARLWKDKHVAVLCEPTNSILKVVRVGAKHVSPVVCPHREAYAEIDRLEAEIIAATPEIALLSCGPTATCLANRLAARGIQAIDIGSAGGFLLKLLAGSHPRWQRPDEWSSQEEAV